MSCWPTEAPCCRPCTTSAQACKHKEVRRGCRVSKTMQNNACLFSFVIFCANLIRGKGTWGRGRQIIYFNETGSSGGVSPALNSGGVKTQLILSLLLQQRSSCGHQMGKPHPWTGAGGTAGSAPSIWMEDPWTATPSAPANSHGLTAC